MDRNKQSWKFCDEEKEGIVKLWKSGFSTGFIAKKFNCDDDGIRILIKARIPAKKYKKIANEHMKKFEERRKLKQIEIPPLSEELGWWVGVIKGDGYLDDIDYYVKLGVRDKEFRDRWVEIGEKLFSTKARTNEKIRDNRPFYEGQFNSKLLIIYLKENFGKFGRYVWDIPGNIKNKPKIIFSFLKGLFDSEGSIKFYPRKMGTVVSLVSVNKKSIFQIERILKKFGINCRIKLYRRKDRKNDYYIIYIGGFYNISKFSKYINFSIKRKRNKLSNYLNYIMLGEDDIDAD